MKSFCLCGEKYFDNWKYDRCCDFLIKKYNTLYGDFHLRLNGNFYQFDNHCSKLYFSGKSLILTIQIDETLPIECIRDKIISIVNNLCFQ